MQKLHLVAVLAAVAIVGFALGRATSGTPIVQVIDGRREIPLFPKPPKDEPAPVAPGAPKTDAGERSLIVEVPVEGAQASDAFVDVAGRVKSGSGEVRIVIEGPDGSVLASAAADIEASSGPYARFTKTITLDGKPVGEAKITVSIASDPAATVTRAILFVDAATVPVKVYFANDRLDPEQQCSLVFPIERRVQTGVAIYRAVLEELLKGPDDAEKAQGYATALPPRAELKSVAADAAGTVTADFTESLERGVAGSCRVTAIRAQITATLMQFPESRDAVITINGRSEDVLQP